ncbi:Lysosomal thioesterase PPT2 [Merluccius polli]|uniref:palmitoyl-CoA hydrolase n=1 Tax=Merluccius polli TaxID=89951 RepID=A0AA47NCK7_MERPO|nr:Lysosomal thioesterase PPT2 [Merluccius polli]
MRGRMMMVVVVVLFGFGMAEDYRPVVIVHGIFDGPKQFSTLSRFITEAHPGTEVEVIDLYDHVSSLHPLWQQVQGFSRALTPIMTRSPAGVHLLCFSQGGLICRALLHTLPHHNVQSFISLSSPQAGQYGGLFTPTQHVNNNMSTTQQWQPKNIQYYLISQCPLWEELMKRNIFHICYNRFGQRVSICNYWNGKHPSPRPAPQRTLRVLVLTSRSPPPDPHHRERYTFSSPRPAPQRTLHPHHRERYIVSSSFLALINAERPHASAPGWKENFLRIRKLVLIGGPDDDVITPWQSSHFGFYDGQENIIDMRKQDYYKEDGFGLKTLDSRGGVVLCQRSGVKHTAWHSNYSVFTGCIAPWLT